MFSLFCSVRSVMHKHLMKMVEVTFDKIFDQKLGKYTQSTCPHKSWAKEGDITLSDV